MWQRDLAVVYSKIAKAHELAGARDKAIEALEKGMNIIRQLIERAPGNAGWKNDLSWFEQTLSTLRN